MVATSTLLAVSAAVAVVGAGVSAYGMYAQGQAQSKMANYNAKVQENNAIASRQQAQYESDRIQERNRRLRGTQAAAASASGLDLSGSVSDVMYDSSLQGEMDSLAAIYKGSVAAGERRSAATLDKFQGDAALTQSYFNTAGTLIGGAGSSIGYWGKYNDAKNNPQLQ